MSKIRVLEDLLISQIAAGEVIERPASVVKELVENALDAGAGSIEIELEGGGRDAIVVRDDGEGMAPEDARLAFERHATSKIRSFEQLESVRSLGFRGEALAAIAAAARVECTTATTQGEGHHLVLRGGRVEVEEPASAPRGTQMEVRSLFADLPARRQFLKSASTELRRCLEIVHGYALARPDVRFDVVHDGRELLRAPSTTEDAAGRLERIAQIFGADFASGLIRLPEDGTVEGFVGPPEGVRSRKTFLFVDRRLVRDRALLGVFYGAVRDVWKTDRFPPLFLFLTVPGGEVDVNVHPQKAEVRFRSREPVRRAASALRTALGEARREAAAPVRVFDGGPAPTLRWSGLGGAGEDHGAPLRSSDGEASSAGAGYRSSGEVAERIAGANYALPSPRRVPLSGRPAAATEGLRLLGHYKGSLVLLEGPDALYLVDQHAAHERILFEQLSQAIAAETPRSQRLLQPLVLDLGADLNEVLSRFSERLEECGFELRPLSDGSLGLVGVPAPLRVGVARQVLEELAARFRHLDPDQAAAGSLRSELLESFVASNACRGAVKIHRPLNGQEMERLVTDLFACDQPYSCPHGRPTVLKMADSELERRFERR
ncbi:MAG: DNA mismatch repair endonuclease MutL [Acidobacteria bacterium]|nr:MAG: DNA mismatch repair endonuclease MutL [Acidobacteriota bacterium]